MKKAFLAVLCAITCIFALNSCTTKSGHRVPNIEAKPDDQSYVEPTTTTRNVDPVQIVVDTLTFIPTEIQVTEPKENQNDILGESQSPGHTYETQIIFLDSMGTEYSIYLWERAYKDEKGVPDPEGEKQITAVKKIFKMITEAKPQNFRVYYRSGFAQLYKESDFLPKKIGNAAVRIDPDYFWSGDCRKVKKIE